MSSISAIDTIQALFVACYNRPADAEGLAFWQNELASGNRSLIDIAAHFGVASETIVTYPFLADSTLSQADEFITAVYQNLFNRDPEPAALTYWTEYFANGGKLATALLSFIQSAQGDDLLALQNKIEVADAYTAATDLGNDYNASEGRGIIDKVDATNASVETGLDTIRDDVYPTQPGGGGGGGTTVIEVEPAHEFIYKNDASLHVSGTKNFAGIEMNYGSGNYADNKVIAIDTHSGVELALGANFRTGNQIVGTSEGDGIARFEGNAGHQVAGVEDTQVTRTDRAAVSFDYSINKGVGAIGDGEQRFFLMIDKDPTINTSFIQVELKATAPGTVIGFLDDGTPILADGDGSNPAIAQDSVNAGFLFWSSQIPGVGPAGSGDIPAGEYTIRLEERAMDGVKVIGAVTAILDLSDPTPVV